MVDFVDFLLRSKPFDVISQWSLLQCLWEGRTVKYSVSLWEYHSKPNASSVTATAAVLYVIILYTWTVYLSCIAPHQPRLDWQMWFAALGSYQHNPWLIHLMYRLLVGQPEVLQLLDLPPFDKPPLYVRAKLYTYHYTDPGCYPSRYVCLSLFVLELDDCCCNDIQYWF